MVTKVICAGATTDLHVRAMVDEYTQRLKNYARVEWIYIELPRAMASQPIEKVKTEEWARTEKHLSPGAYLILLDEKGKEYTSAELAARIQKIMNAGHKEMAVVIGGAYGFPEAAYKKANETIALSRLTFTHQMVRAVWCEQLYRAHTILKGEKYHH